MENKSILSNLSQIENYIEKLEQENERLRGKLAKLEPEPEQSETNGPIAFDCLAVTNVQLFALNSSDYLGSIKAFASVVLNNQLQLRGLRVVNGTNGLFVNYPADPFHEGEEYRSVCAPITRALREHIEARVIEKYQQAIGG
jgi:stage V sporulation protein G